MFIASKGKDEVGTDTGAETNIDMEVMWDAGSSMGMSKGTFKIGLEYQYWKNKFVKDGRALSFEEAMAEMRDAAGRPGPSTWEGGRYPDGQDHLPVAGVSPLVNNASALM